jgi:hypothetical protein
MNSIKMTVVFAILYIYDLILWIPAYLMIMIKLAVALNIHVSATAIESNQGEINK